MPLGKALPVGRVNSVTVPLVVMRPICPASACVNHSAPSGPTVMKSGKLARLDRLSSVTTPLVVIRPI
jgi:hypothetical protein